MEKNPRFENDDDIGELTLPDAKRIACRDFKFREEDRMDGMINGATLGLCEKYFMKPKEVLWENADCPEWESEDDEEAADEE